MNSVQIIGNISTDLDFKITPQGHAVVKFNVAVNNPYNREKVSFIPVEAWRRSAELINDYCVKGNKIGIVGSIEVDQYEKDGQKRTFTKVVAQNIEFLTPKGSQAGGNSQGNTNTHENQNNAGNGNRGQNTRIDNDPFQVNDSDLPF